MAAAAEVLRGIEPAPGKVEAADLAAVRAALEQVAAGYARRGALDGLSGDAVVRLEARSAALHAHAAAIAIAADDAGHAARWLAEAERLSRDDEQRAELAAARASHERFRQLVHGRVMIARGNERAARAAWRALRKGKADDDAIARAAAEELDAPRPLRPGDRTPTLSRINGIGAGFYGRRKRWPDGSYATMHCFSVLWIPVIPLSGWRVRDAQGGYEILGREPLPRWAQRARWILPVAAAVAIAVAAGVSYLDDPDRLARGRWDAALAAVRDGDAAEASLRRIDDEIAHDLPHVDSERAQRAGAEIVRLAAGRVDRPLTAAALDQATRVVRRYRALPVEVRTGVAQAAMFAVLERWIGELGDAPGAAEPRLALLTDASDLAPTARKPALAEQITAARLALATARQTEWPLDALALLVEHPADARDHRVIDAADRILERLADSPSLLLDAGDHVALWSAATHDAAAKARISGLRDQAQAGRTEAEAEGVTAPQLGQMLARRPWDQYVQLQLARGEAEAGKLDAAIARIARIGPPGMMVSELRFLHAQLVAAQGKLDAADAMLSSLLAGRLPRFAAASAALTATAAQVEARVRRALDAGNVPDELRRKVEAASDDTRRNELVSQWMDDQMKNDAALSDAREKYRALADIVPVALASGSIKLRRAQALSGAARSAMLEDAERTFLAIRGAAEGRPEFRLALGETYARLGKIAESDAELGAVLANGSPGERLSVAHVYRSLGGVARARQIAEQVFSAASEAGDKQRAAGLLGILTSEQGLEDEAERWFRQAGNAPDVTANLLEIEATRLERQGKTAECAAKFAEVAKLQLATATSSQAAGYNNAALAYERGFDCSGDPAALRSAERTLETAYRSAPDGAIVVGNLAHVLDLNGQARVLARHIDTRALRLPLSDIVALIDGLIDGPEREALRAELAADPGVRRGLELLAQAEVLAPSNVRLISIRFAAAYRGNDAAAADAVLERARRAKALDTSELAADRVRERGGDEDAKLIARSETMRARLEPLLTGAGVHGGLDARTRAAAAYLTARALSRLGLYQGDAALLARARTAAATATQLWPALDTGSLIVTTLIDEAGVTADAKAWLAARRLRHAAGALDRLAADHAALADRIRASPLWAEVAGHARADRSRPSPDEVRLAHLLGDAELEARARAAFDDHLIRVGLELGALLDPGDEVARDDLAYLNAKR
jgi:hypothetical protein